MEKIAAKLISARKAKGLTQGDVALALGIKPRTYQRYEAGEFPKYRAEVIKEVDNLLGTSVYVELYDKECDTWNVGAKNAATRPETGQNGQITSEPGFHPDHLKYVALLERTNATLEKSIQLSLNAIQITQADLLTYARENDNRTLELLALKREDVDMVGLRFKSIIKKGRNYVEKWRPIKLIAAPLWDEVMHEAAPGEYLFSKGLKPGSERIRSDQVGKRWKRHVKDKLGITADFYSIRHTSITEMVELLGEKAAMLQTGHTTPQMIRSIYDVRRSERLDEAVRSAENKFA